MGGVWKFVDFPRKRWRGGHIDLCRRINAYQGFSFDGLQDGLEAYIKARQWDRRPEGELDEGLSLFEVASALAGR